LCEPFIGFLNERIIKIEEEYRMENLQDISKMILQEKSEILGQLMLTFIEKKFGYLLYQQTCTCPLCKKKMEKHSPKSRTIETLAGRLELKRPYFYCRGCHYGFFPLDEALQLSDSSKQYDVQEAQTWLSSEMPYETACETIERITGMQMSEHHMHTTTNNVSQCIEMLDVFPTKEEVDKIIGDLSHNKHRRPILMLAIDGAHAPTRPEPTPHPRDMKRGKGKWKEVKGFRLYLLDKKETIHIASWHQICDDQQLAADLQTVKDTGIIDESKIRLALIGDGAAWIWNRCKEIFPSAKEILDYYHCSEYVYDVGNAYYGKETLDAGLWCERILTSIYYGYHEEVLNELLCMKSEAKSNVEEVDKFYTYLKNNCSKMNYDTAKRGGYHIGSGAIESANKFISHVRIKRSGAWWYSENANNILKIRCAKYNGTYDKIMRKYKIVDQAQIAMNKNPNKCNSNG
jgi:hypothetical protein